MHSKVSTIYWLIVVVNRERL